MWTSKNPSSPDNSGYWGWVLKSNANWITVVQARSSTIQRRIESDKAIRDQSNDETRRVRIEVKTEREPREAERGT
jgi:hypothetical protein